MPESPSSSFIPKRGAAKNKRPAGRKYNFFILSIISYALFVAAPIASAVVFIYEKYTEKVFAQAVIDLDTAINTFSEADMQRVVEFEDRLVAADQLLNSHVSLVSLMNILESNTAATIQFNSLAVERTSPDKLTATAAITTDEFDALLFQRGIYKGNEQIADTKFSAVTFAGAAGEETSSSVSQTEVESANDTKSITLQAGFEFSADSILYTPTLVMDETAGLSDEEMFENENEADIPGADPDGLLYDNEPNI